MKPLLSNVSLICIDTTPKARLGVRALEQSLEQCSFGEVKLLTNDSYLKYSVQIPEIKGLEAYSHFCVRDLHKYVSKDFCLLVQSDGYVLNGQAWFDDFLAYDYIGAPWLPSKAIGNGGFSLRSRKLLNALAQNPFGDNPHPEDNYICVRHRKQLEKMGIRFPDYEIASLFAFEGRSWNNGIEWESTPEGWNGQFGFHSWLTKMPPEVQRPKVFHHTGDYGDVIYSLPVMKQLGGGVLFLSPDIKYPFPTPPRCVRNPNVTFARWCENITPLLESQSYIDSAKYTHALPYSTDYDLNKFREPWSKRTAQDFESIFKLHQKAFSIDYPDNEPWITVADPVSIEGRPIVVNRTARYQNFDFPWDKLIRKYGHQMIFIGSTQEHELFNGIGYPEVKVPRHITRNLLEVAQVIAGAKCCIMNQSSPLSIALGLCKNVIVETWPLNSNCVIPRDNAIYWTHGPVEVPPQWI